MSPVSGPRSAARRCRGSPSRGSSTCPGAPCARPRRTYAAAVVPPIAAVPLVLGGDLAADLDDATRLLATFDAGGAGEIAPVRVGAAALRECRELADREPHVVGAGPRRGRDRRGLAGQRRGDPGQRAHDAGGARPGRAPRRGGGARHAPGTHVAAVGPRAPAPGASSRCGSAAPRCTPVTPTTCHPWPRDVPALMADLVRFMDRDDLPPLAHAALAHAQFETIHPFTDGNGRTGGPCCTRCCCTRGRSTGSPCRSRPGLLALRDDYFAALGAYRAGDAEPILRCVAEAARSGTHIGERLVATLRGVRAEWAGRLTATSGLRVVGPARPAPAPARRHGTCRRARARGHRADRAVGPAAARRRRHPARVHRPPPQPRVSRSGGARRARRVCRRPGSAGGLSAPRPLTN